MFQSCYTNHSRTVGIVGPSAEIISNLNFHEIYSVTLIDTAVRAELEIPSDKHAPRHKLQTFLVSISSATELEKKLQHLKTSQWWNHMASFLIIDNPRPLDQGCSKAFAILYTAWKMNMLHTKFFCYHESKGSLIYSYNPYTDKAPLLWQLEKTYKRKNEHPWTLLVRSYQDSREICKDLNFDQTKDLGGYEIRSSMLRLNINANSSRTDLKSISDSTATIASYIFGALNATSKTFISPSRTKVFGMTPRGFTDILLNSFYQQNNLNSSMTYPHWRSGLATITQHRGNLSQIDKLLRVIDHTSRYGVLIVTFVTFVFFKFFFRQSVTSAILSIVRLICNSSIRNVPNDVAVRIYLSGLFVFIVTIQAIYQGKFASLLTKPVALPNVETFEDLENFKYTIYGHTQRTLYFKWLNYRGRVVGLQDFDCAKYVLRDKAAACVDDRLRLLNIANELDLHLSKAIIPMSLVFIIRQDWPVEERLNAVISRLVEGNMIDGVIMKDFEIIIRKQKSYEQEQENQGPAVITLKELAFAFACLGIGLAGATVVFLLEIWMGRR